jgi:hypothetical protein
VLEDGAARGVVLDDGTLLEADELLSSARAASRPSASRRRRIRGARGAGRL